MQRMRWLAIAGTVWLAGCGGDKRVGGGTKESRNVALQVAKTSGLDAWAGLTRIRFTWRHGPGDVGRTYDWDIPAGMVTATIAGKSVVVPRSAAQASAPLTDEQVAAHQAFVNDSYWLLFALHLAWDVDAKVEDLGFQPVPQRPDLGRLRAIATTYPPKGGYTPGDRYVLYLSEELVPIAWAFHRAGATQPSLVTSRQDYKRVGGLNLPTAFLTPDGKPVITITDLAVD